MQDVQGIAEMVKIVGCRIQILGRGRREKRSWLGREGSRAEVAPLLAPVPRLCSPLTSSCDQLIMSESEMNSWLFAVVKDGADRIL